MTVEIILTVGYICLFLWIIKESKFFSLQNIPINWIALVFILKIFCGILLEIIYTRYYALGRKADIFKYFDDSAVVFNSLFVNQKHFFQLLFGINSSAEYLQPYYQKMQWWQAPFNELFYNDARTMIRINALMRFLSIGYYNAHVVFFNFLSLVGMTALYKSFVARIQYPSVGNSNNEDISNTHPKYSKLLFAGIFLLPSVLLWSSGVLKEAFLLFVLGMLLYIFLKIVHDKLTPLRLALCILFLFLHLITKIHLLAILIPGLISYYIVAKQNYKMAGLIFLIVHLTYFLIFFNLHYLIPAINIPALISSQYSKYLKFAQDVHSGSLLIANDIQPTAFSILKNSLYSFFIVITHPYLFESKSIFMIIAGAENLLILVMVAIALFNFNLKSIKRNAAFYFSFYFFVLTFTLIGLTTPVLGTIVRYKVPALPFLMVAAITLYQKGRELKINKTLG